MTLSARQEAQTRENLERLMAHFRLRASTDRICPTNREIAGVLGVSSLATPARYVAMLAECKRIELHRAHSSRAIVIDSIRLQSLRIERPKTETRGSGKPRGAKSEWDGAHRHVPPAGPSRPLPKSDAAPETALPFIELTSRHCRWPVGEADGCDQMFCAAPVVDGASYCECHSARAVSRLGRLATMRLRALA